MKKGLALLMALLMIVPFAACGSEDDYAHGSTETVLKLGEHEVPEELYRYFLLNTMDEMAKGNATFFTSDDREQRLKELDERVLKGLKEYYAVLDLAEKQGIKLTEKEQQQAADAIVSLRESCADDAEYNAGLEDSYLSEYVAYSLGYNELLYAALYQTLSETGKSFKTDNKTVENFAMKNFLFCRQFVVESAAIGADSEAEAKAENIRERLQNGEDPETVAKDFGKDNSVIVGYYCFAETEDFDALDEEAVKKMKEGEVSDIYVDGYGYHIVMRLAPDREYVKDHIAEEVFESYCMYQMSVMMKEIEDGYSVKCVNKKDPEEYR